MSEPTFEDAVQDWKNNRDALADFIDNIPNSDFRMFRALIKSSNSIPEMLKVIEKNVTEGDAIDLIIKEHLLTSMKDFMLLGFHGACLHSKRARAWKD